MNIYFLGSQIPLTKQFFKEGTKSNYPNAYLFTSYKEEITSPSEMFKKINEHANQGRCLIKGTLQRNLNNEPRAGATKTEVGTQWLCLDLDRAPFATAEEFISRFECFNDVSYIIQYSSSHGAPETEGTTSAHIFIMLDKAVSPPALKAWLMNLNMTDEVLKKGIQLTRSGAALRWPLDITTCQNDKLLYIAPPIFEAPLKPFIKTRIELKPKKLNLMPTSRIPTLQIEAQQKKAKQIRNQLRAEANLEPIRAAIKHVGEYEVQSKPGAITQYEVFDDGDWVRFNFNGGDSKGYYHPKDNIELIHNFKGEPSYYTKEILPDYYKERMSERKREAQQPTEKGEQILGFIDFWSQRYHIGSWNPATKELILTSTDSEAKLNHFLEDKGKPLFGHVPNWNVEFDPTSDVIVGDRYVNLYVPSPLLRTENPKGKWPFIKSIVMSAVSGNEENETYHHFMNWLATIIQLRIKTQAAWLLNGTEGTGKGLLITIIQGIIGRQYVKRVEMGTLLDKFNDYLMDSLIVFYDEMDIEAMNDEKGAVAARIRNYVTEEELTLRGMHRDPRQIKNYTNFMFASNRNKMVELTDSDRRFNVGIMQTKKFVTTREEVKAKIEAELPYFTEYITSYKININQASTILKSEARKTMISASKTSVDMICDAIRDGDFQLMWDSRTDATVIQDTHGVGASGTAYQYNEIMLRILKELATSGKDTKEGVTVTVKHPREEMYFMLAHNVGRVPPEPAKFSRYCAHHNLDIKPYRNKENTTVRGREVLWTAPKKWVLEQNALQKKPLKLVK